MSGSMEIANMWELLDPWDENTATFQRVQCGDGEKRAMIVLWGGGRGGWCELSGCSFLEEPGDLCSAEWKVNVCHFALQLLSLISENQRLLDLFFLFILVCGFYARSASPSPQIAVLCFYVASCSLPGTVQINGGGGFRTGAWKTKHRRGEIGFPQSQRFWGGFT